MELHLEALTPEARAAVEKLAKESGKPFAVVLSKLVVRGAARAENGRLQSGDQQVAAWEKFLAAGRLHTKTIPERRAADDSRESIYGGRGE